MSSAPARPVAARRLGKTGLVGHRARLWRFADRKPPWGGFRSGTPKPRWPPPSRRACATSTWLRSTPAASESSASAMRCARSRAIPTCCPRRWGGCTSRSRRTVPRRPAPCPSRSASTTATTEPCAPSSRASSGSAPTGSDIALIHDIDPFTHGSEAAAEARRREAMDGAFAALGELRRQGVVTAIGIGATDWRVMEACAREADFDCFLLAMQYSLLRHDCLASFLAALPFEGHSGHRGGAVRLRPCWRGEAPAPVPGNTGPRMKRRGAGWRQWKRSAQATERASSRPPCGFPSGIPPVPAVLPGPRNAAHMEACVRAMAEPIPGALWDELTERGLIRADAPVPAPRLKARPAKLRYPAASNPGTLNSRPGLSATISRRSSSDTPVLATMTSHSRNASTGGGRT